MAILFSFSSLGTLAQSLEGLVVASTLNVRGEPVVDPANILSKIASGAIVIIEGRNEANDWLYVRTQDSGVAGWVATRYVQFDASQLGNIPVTAQSGTAQSGTISAPVTNIPAASLSLVMETPIFHNMATGTVYDVFSRGQQLGNNARAFMKVGDSVTATQPFLIGFGNGNYDLGGYGSLQATIDFFSVSPVKNVANSFMQNSVAAVNGFVSGAVFDGTWSPEYCGRLVPLQCEYDIVRPSVAVVMFGGQDVRLFDAAFFQTNMERIVVDLKALGVIPLLSTFPMHASYRYEQTIQYNTIVISIANKHNVPLINFYRALQALPEGGALVQDPVHLTQGETYFSFNGEETLYGVSLRNFLTLQALDTLRSNVLQR